MDYNILEARIFFEKGKLEKVSVLVEMSKNDVRAISATTRPTGGYMNILPTTEINSELLQKVAAAGFETVDRDKVFPKWKAKYKQSLKN